MLTYSYYFFGKNLFMIIPSVITNKLKRMWTVSKIQKKYVINPYYYMASVCGRYNARSDWLIVNEL